MSGFGKIKNKVNFLRSKRSKIYNCILLFIILVLLLCLVAECNNRSVIEQLFDTNNDEVSMYINDKKTINFSCKDNDSETEIAGGIYRCGTSKYTLFATFSIDEDDANGIILEFPAGYKIETLRGNYRLGLDNSWESLKREEFPNKVVCNKYFVSSHYEPDDTYFVQIAYDRVFNAKKPSGGESGTVFIDLSYDNFKAALNSDSNLKIVIVKECAIKLD